MEWKSRAELPLDDAKVLAVHRFQGILAVKGREVRENILFSHWGRSPAEGWIRRDDRLPRRQDADLYNCVLAWNADEGVCVTGWHRVTRDGRFSAWMPMPEGPLECD